VAARSRVTSLKAYLSAFAWFRELAFDDDGSGACCGEARLVRGNVVDGVRRDGGRVYDDVADGLAVEKGADAEVVGGLGSGLGTAVKRPST
jgi:hypothetical protein